MENGHTQRGWKLTNPTGQTHGETQWGPGVTHTARGVGTAFCSADLIHFYSHPIVAILHNPWHGAYIDPLLWEVEAAEPIFNDRGLKLGAKKLTTLQLCPVPQLSLLVRVRYAILVAKKVFSDKAWVTWADAWLAGENRGYSLAVDASVYATFYAVCIAASAAARAAANYAAHAARADVSVDEAAATCVAFAARAASSPLDFPSLAEQAVREEALLTGAV